MEISGMEVIGPNEEISLEQAMADRLVKSNKFLGKGIVSWSGNNINIHHNTVHHCPNSGVRVDKVSRGDFCTLILPKRACDLPHIWFL